MRPSESDGFNRATNQKIVRADAELSLTDEETLRPEKTAVPPARTLRFNPFPDDSWEYPYNEEIWGAREWRNQADGFYE